MRREDALKDYNEQVRPLLEEGRQELEEGLKAADDREDRILNAVDQLCEKAVEYQQMGKKEKISLFQISLLTASLQEGPCRLQLNAYDSRGYLDREPVELLLSADWMFQPLQDLRKKLYERTMVYMGKVERFDADRLVTDLAVTFYRKSAEEFRPAFMNLDQRPAFQPLEREYVFAAKWGELRGTSGTLFVADSRAKSQEELEWAYSGAGQEQGKEAFHMFDCWDQTEFEELELVEKKLLYPSFRFSQFRKCLMGNCIVAGGNFFRSELTRSVFLSDGLSSCSFRQARLTDVHFLKCDLSNTDFRGAEITESTFYGSNMDHAIFSRSAVAGLHLEPSQLQQITIGEE